MGAPMTKSGTRDGDRAESGAGEGSSSAGRTPVDADCGIETLQPLAEHLRRRVYGQEHAIEALICSYSRLLSGLHDVSRPLFTGLLLGPTGVGKTETARAVAHALFGTDDALTRINGQEYAHGHEIARLLGAPPGYVGQDVEPLLSQDRVDAPHRDARARRGEEGVLADRIFGARPDRFESVILFDEIEKGHPLLWNALLGILEDGTVTLGNTESTDLTRSIVLMTSNVGSREMGELLEGPSLGFARGSSSREVELPAIRETALEAAREVFPLEFLNRFDEILVYSPLSAADLDGIFGKFLADIHERTLRQARVPLLIRVSERARRRIIEWGTDARFGARPLRRVMERRLVDPLSRLIASGKLDGGDIVEVEVEPDGRGGEETLRFYRAPREEREGRVVA